MQLSNDTVNILKNFSAINQSIVFKEGNVVKTISPQKTVMAIATVEDEFPQQAGIYNLPRFLSVCSMHESPQLDFGDRFVTITEGKSKTKYVYADPSMIITPPEKEINLPSVDMTVTLSPDNLSKVLKATSVLQLPEIAFVGENGTCYLRAIDSANPSADSFGVELGETDDTFSLIIKTENLQIMPLEYEVELSSKGISRFKSDKVTYFIAIESKSTYKKGDDE
jgi:hypothetical protein